MILIVAKNVNIYFKKIEIDVDIFWKINTIYLKKFLNGLEVIYGVA